MTLQILELFGGIGSPRVALRNMGIPTKSIDYVEIDQKAVDSYNAIFSNELDYKTQSVVKWNLKPDILIHGSPCQDISVAGVKLGADKNSGTRSSLMWETINIIKQMGMWRPKIVIWENVKGVLHKNMRKNFNKYLAEMEKMGYINNFEVLNAIDFGLPQKRERVFVVSILSNNMFNFKLMRRQAMSDIQDFLEVDVSEEYTITQPSMLKVIGKPLAGSKFRGYVPIIKDFTWTISTKQMRNPNSGAIDLGNKKFRVLTPQECWLLQGYELEDFINASEVNGKTKLYEQAGNSIPVSIFESMFEVLLA